tara:strand:+ start:600 stop:917 length:318 start_codon:yes stop_codon:yes gene_type:complete
MSYKIKKWQAINSLKPSAEYILRGGTLEWLDKTQTEPSESDIQTEMTRLQTEYDNNAYARKRALEYPSVQDFIEAYTEKEIGGDSTKWDAYKTAYNKVRTDNPKE